MAEYLNLSTHTGRATHVYPTLAGAIEDAHYLARKSGQPVPVMRACVTVYPDTQIENDPDFDAGAELAAALKRILALQNDAMNRSEREKAKPAPPPADEMEFWLVWSPDGRFPPSKRHASEAEARAEAKRLAASKTGSDFFVLRATSRHRVTRPVEARVEDAALGEVECPF